MEIFLLSLLSCSDGKWILQGLNRVENFNTSEVRIEIINSMPDNCEWEEYNPGESTR